MPQVGNSVEANEENGVVSMMREFGIEMTRENYLDLAYFGKPPEELSAEEEADLPIQFRSSDGN